ncbi:TetR/AcrR family transcriptional regulator [Nocardioides zeae]
MASRASTEKKLLDAADRLLFRRGVVATPVDEVLALAGVSPATLYRAFGSKDGLLVAALERRLDDWLATWEAAVAAAPDDEGRLLAVLDALEEFRARPDGARWCAFLGSAAEHADPRRRWPPPSHATPPSCAPGCGRSPYRWPARPGPSGWPRPCCSSSPATSRCGCVTGTPRRAPRARWPPRSWPQRGTKRAAEATTRIG